MHRVERQHRANSADHARGDHAGVSEFGIEAQDADEKQEKENIRVNDTGQEFLTRGEMKFVQAVIFEGEFYGFTVEALDLTAVQLLQEVRVVAGDQINQMPCERFVLGERLRVGHRSFGKF